MRPQKILFFDWKDINHPNSGGAEIVTHKIMEGLVSSGHQVTLLTARYAESTEFDNINGVDIIRTGTSRFGHYFSAYSYYKKNLKNQFDTIIEEVNTIPYLTGLYKGHEKSFVFYHQLARQIWFYEMIQPLSTVGFLIEPFYTFLQSRINPKLITISNSTKNDMIRYGFKTENITIISEGLENKPLVSLTESEPKEKDFTILFHSSLRPMKRPVEVLKAFKIVLAQNKNAKLWVSGGGGRKNLEKYSIENCLTDSVTFFGRTTEEQKFSLMQKSHVLCSTSIKEGWGLIVTEANSMGTPVVVYDVDGLRDASKHSGGFVVKPKPKELASKLIELQKMIETSPQKYHLLRQTALDSSKKITYNQCINDFENVINKK
jgi:glycosyltransferase involved in cell wall biosynthesis